MLLQKDNTFLAIIFSFIWYDICLTDCPILALPYAGLMLADCTLLAELYGISIKTLYMALYAVFWLSCPMPCPKKLPIFDL